MNYTSLIDYVFEYGCGTTMKDVTDSAAFQGTLAREQACYVLHPSSTPLGAMLRRGHPGAALALQQVLSGGTGISTPESRFVRTSQSRVEQALLRELGSRLIAAATRCLPGKLGRTEKIWAKISKSEQQLVIEKFYDAMQSQARISSKRKRGLNRDASASDLPRRPYFPEQALPLQYGKFGQSSIKPNCLGTAQLLIAFARRIGAPVMLANLLVHPRVERWHSEGIFSDALLRDMKRHHLLGRYLFIHTLEEHVKRAHYYRNLVEDFHHAVVVQTRSGQWIYVDPHCDMIGPLPEKAWHLNKIYATLREYEPVLPGLSLVGHDHGSLREHFNAARQRAFMALDPLEAFILNYYHRFETMPTDLNEFVNFCCRHWAVKTFFRDPNLGGEPGRILAHLFATLDDNSASHDEIQKRFADDDGFRFRCIDAVMCEFHRIAGRMYRNAVSDLRTDGLYLPPALEFSLPEVNVALFTLNHLRHWAEDFNKLPAEWLIEHSSSQLLWQQSARRRPNRTRRQQLMCDQTERLVRSLEPHVHVACRYDLRRLDQEREDRNGQKIAELEVRSPDDQTTC